MRNGFNNCVEQVCDTYAWFIHVIDGPAVLGSSVDDWIVELLIGGFEIAEEVKYFILDLIDATRRPVHFVDYHNGFDTLLKCF